MFEVGEAEARVVINNVVGLTLPHNPIDQTALFFSK